MGRMLPVGDAAQALGVSVDTLRRWEKGGRIVMQRDRANRRMVDESEITRLGGHLTHHVDHGFSARNRFEGVVKSVEVSGVIAQVEIESGSNFSLVDHHPRRGRGAGPEAGCPRGGDRQGDVGDGGAAVRVRVFSPLLAGSWPAAAAARRRRGSSSGGSGSLIVFAASSLIDAFPKIADHVPAAASRVDGAVRVPRIRRACRADRAGRPGRRVRRRQPQVSGAAAGREPARARPPTSPRTRSCWPCRPDNPANITSVHDPRQTPSSWSATRACRSAPTPRPVLGNLGIDPSSLNIVSQEQKVTDISASWSWVRLTPGSSTRATRRTAGDKVKTIDAAGEPHGDRHLSDRYRDRLEEPEGGAAVDRSGDELAGPAGADRRRLRPGAFELIGAGAAGARAGSSCCCRWWRSSLAAT